MFEADPPLPTPRGPGAARAAIAVLGAVLLAGAAFWLVRDRGPEPLETATTPGDVPLGNAPSSRQTRVTELAPAGGEPVDLDRCEPAAREPPATGCRISASLATPPIPSDPTGTDAARAMPDAPAFSPPLTFGLPAVLDAANPAILVDGTTYFLFTSASRLLRVPVATVPASDVVAFGDGLPGFAIGRDDGGGPRGTVPRTEAMPEAPAWVAPGQGVASPTVARFGARYVMFFAANRPDPPDTANPDCVGRAVSLLPEGPYLADPEPFSCGLEETHGAFDPDVFRDPRDGRAYLHLAFGGTSTPLWTMPLTRDADPAGPPAALLRMHQPWERWFLQGPAMFFDGTDYVLTYSSGDWRTPRQSIGLARCSSPSGPCTSSSAGPWLTSLGRVTGPGGLDVDTDVDGNLLAAHHAFVAGEEGVDAARHTYLRRVEVDDGLVTLD